MNKLTIIVPVYNVEKYLDDCVTSILKQTYPYFTLILVDDGSTDSSGVMCDEWCDKDSRIKVLHKPNEGAMSAWKYGVMQSDSKYIGFIDSDDRIDTNMYEVLIDAIEKYNADMVSFDIFSSETIEETAIDIIDRNNKRLLYPHLISGNSYKNRGFSFNRVSKVLKREIVEKSIAFCDNKVTIGEDFLASFCFVQYADIVVNLRNFNPYHYTIRGDSTTTKYSDNRFSKIDLLRKYMLKANKIDDYDFSIQINTDYIKLILNELDNDILDSGKNIRELESDMKKIFSNTTFQEAVRSSEVEKLPVKYQLYLFFLKHKLYYFAFMMRRLKKG